MMCLPMVWNIYFTDSVFVRSAREAKQLEADAVRKGEVLPTDKRFDSNCITPGM